jgi:hypothetical protein
MYPLPKILWLRGHKPSVLASWRFRIIS